MGLSVFKQQGKYGVKNEMGEVVIHPRFERIVLVLPWIIAWSKIDYDTNEFRYNSRGERYFSVLSAVGGKSHLFYANGSEFHLRCSGLPSDICITDIVGTKRWEWESVYKYDIYKATAIINGEKKACLFKSDGEIILPFRYDDIRPIGNKYLVLCNSTYQYKNRVKFLLGRQINDIVKSRISAKYGLLSDSFKEVIPIKFDGIMKFSDDDDEGNHYYGEEVYYRVRMDKLYGLLDKEGGTILPTSFSYIDSRIISEYTRIITYYKGGEYFDGEYARYVKDGKWGFFLPDYNNNYDSGPIFDAISFSKSLPELDSIHVKIIAEDNLVIPSNYHALAMKDNIVGFIVDKLRFIPYWELDGYARKIFLDHNYLYYDDSRVNDNSGWTPDEIRRANYGAFEMDPNAQWNID